MMFPASEMSSLQFGEKLRRLTDDFSAADEPSDDDGSPLKPPSPEVMTFEDFRATYRPASALPPDEPGGCMPCLLCMVTCGCAGYASLCPPYANLPEVPEAWGPWASRMRDYLSLT